MSFYKSKVFLECFTSLVSVSFYPLRQKKQEK